MLEKLFSNILCFIIQLGEGKIQENIGEYILERSCTTLIWCDGQDKLDRLYIVQYFFLLKNVIKSMCISQLCGELKYLDMEGQFRPLTQTMPRHSSIICPVSPSGKQSMSFSELFCFPFTITDKDKMNQGLFVEGQNERKKEKDYDFLKS